MDIIIVSRRRAHKQTTWNSLPATVQSQTKIAVWEDEYDDYRDYPTIVVPWEREQKHIGAKRQFLLDTFNTPLLVMDDDLTFARRREDDDTKFHECMDGDILDMLDAVERECRGYAHGGIAMREGANRNPHHTLMNTRILRAHYYDPRKIRAAGARVDRMSCMEDFDLTLQLLRAGCPNLMVNNFVQNQAGSGNAGGCSLYRSPEVQADAAKLLKHHHPDFVTIVEKETKGAWGGGKRIDVRIQWKKAYASGLGTL